MTPTLREIQHPGPVALQRTHAAATALREVVLELPAGRTLLDAVTQALARVDAHVHSAVLRLGADGRGTALFPFAWVMPALSKTPAHAVYFSDRFDADAPVSLLDATVTFGQRQGQPFLHTHAEWRDAQGQRRCGHVLPADAVLAEPMPARAWLLSGAGFDVLPDAETAFSLFQPVARAVPGLAPAPHPALAVRLAPNVDVCLALESLCREHGLSHATVRGGVGSTVGAAFDDGRVVEPFVTETLIRHGRIGPGPDGLPQATLDVSLVDHTGGIHDGRLARGCNAVLVTFELVLDPA